MIYGTEKAAGETDWKRRMGYSLLGEMHIAGRLRIWHVLCELPRLGYWPNRPLTLLDARVVRNLARALKPRGSRILTSPSVPRPKHLPIVASHKKRIGFGPADYGDGRHLAFSDGLGAGIVGGGRKPL